MVDLTGHLMGHLIPNYSILRKASQPNIDITLSIYILKYEFIKIRPSSLCKASLTRPRIDQYVTLCEDLKMINESENKNKR